MAKRKKPNALIYGIVKLLSQIVAKVIFKRKYLRNELKGKKGPAVVLGNHQAALDFTTVIGATREHISFVISDSFYNTLPFRSAMDKIGVIAKQQFQTSLHEIGAMRNVIKHGGILMFYPAGLMSENGLSTPFPAATYKFLTWLEADVYVARITGSYFCTPKWSKKIRRGKTLLDVYKLIDKNDLQTMHEDEIQRAVDGALLFDAYREQEQHRIRYRGGDNVEGLQHVLYVCPHCNEEFTIRVKNKRTLYCEKCGFEHTSDAYGFLHNTGTVGEEIRYVSDWSRFVSDKVQNDIESGKIRHLSCPATLQTIDRKKKKYQDVGRVTVTLTPTAFLLNGTVNGEETNLKISTALFASLPFKPGERIEIQHGKTSYRCLLDDGRLAQKFVDMIKIYYQKNQAEAQKKPSVL